MSSKLVKGPNNIIDPNEQVIAVIQITNKGVLCQAPNIHPQVIVSALQNFIVSLYFQMFQMKEQPRIEPVAAMPKLDS